MKKMADFDKESFKKDVINNVKNLFRKTIDEATQEQVFQAVSYAVKDHIIDRCYAEGIRGEECKDCLLPVYGVPYGPCTW